MHNDSQSFWSAHDLGGPPWFIVAAYLLAFGMAAWAASRTTSPPERCYWSLAAAGLLFLAVNKQLDLQTELTGAVREIATRGGWFEHRRAAQAAFFAGGALLALAVAACLAWLSLASGAGAKFALFGLVLLGGHILLRGALFNHVSPPLGGITSKVLDHNLLELGCILVVLGGELRAVFRR